MGPTPEMRLPDTVHGVHVIHSANQIAEHNLPRIRQLDFRKFAESYIQQRICPCRVARQKPNVSQHRHFYGGGTVGGVGADIVLPARVPRTRSSAPARIAMSARLKMPVRNAPMPTFKKSVTRPSYSRRSIKLLIPPPARSASATNREVLRRRAKSAAQTNPTRIIPTAAVNSVKRRCSGSDAPRLKNEPGFSVSCRRRESENSDSVTPEWSMVRAADFDTWSHPTQQDSVSITTMNLGMDRIVTPSGALL